MSENFPKHLHTAAQAIYDKKGVNILALDVRGVSSLTDYLLIAEGNVERHVTALANEIIKTLKELGEIPLYVEGIKTGDWAVIDYGHFIIHLFMPGLRELYDLDKLWGEGKLISLEIAVVK